MDPFMHWLENAFVEHAQSNALEIGSQKITYQTLWSTAISLREQLLSSSARDATENPAHIGILGHRSAHLYAGIIGILQSGKGYMPMNVKFPSARLETMIRVSGVRQLVICPEASVLGEQLKTQYPELELIYAPEVKTPKTRNKATPIQRLDYFATGNSNPAYLMFTSGSTGTPKGVPISIGNLTHYLAFMTNYCQLTPEDRCSQTFDLSFDLGVHDLFVTWLSGACLCVLPDAALFAPGMFIKKNQLSSWFSVPSVAGCMQTLKMLKPNAYPKLRLSLFCGETLTTELAQKWQKAAPNSRLVNLYGPTEATIACTAHEIKPNQGHGPIVPIGRPFGDNQAQIKHNELYVGGPQVATRYLNPPEKDRDAFFCDHGTNWYRTGDRASWIKTTDRTDEKYNNQAMLNYLGRMDDQVKINGFRIELLEIDAIIRQSTTQGLIKTIAWPLGTNQQAPNIYVFIQGKKTAELEEQITQACQLKLPPYMQPKALHFIKEMPMNSNGKIDKQALIQQLESLNYA